MFDCHTHSNFSGDSRLDMDIACQIAISKGLKGLAFTDHIDLDYPKGSIEYIFDKDKYSDYIDIIKDRYRNSLKVLKGVETGLQKHTLDETAKIVHSYDFDIVLGSIHVIDNLELHNNDYCRNKSKYEAYTGYLNYLFDIFKIYNDYDVLAHFDIIKRYGDYPDKTLNYRDYSDIIDGILKLVISKGKGLEVNTSGFRYKLGETLPSITIIQRYKELGGEIITLGSDAHDENSIGEKFDYITDMLKSYGIKYISYFEKRIVKFIKI